MQGKHPQNAKQEEAKIVHRDPPDKGWYFSKERLLATPSATEGKMPPRQVKLLLTKGVEFLQTTGMRLRLPQLTIATAVVYFRCVMFELLPFPLF